MTGGAVLKLFEMLLVAEMRRTGLFHLVDNLFYLVAFAAVMGVKCLLAVMARSTRLPPVHFCHGVMLFTLVAAVTRGTAESLAASGRFFGQMLAVTENNRTGIFGAVGNIFQLYRPGMGSDQADQTSGYE
jgi:hypothetical protein